MKPYLIFDFDGTLVQSKELAIYVLNKLAVKYGGRTVNSDEIDDLSEMSIPDRMRVLNIPMYRLPALLIEGKKEYRKLAAKLQPVEGIISVLYFLKQKGYSLGLLSSNRQDVICPFLEVHQLHVFDFVHSVTNLFGKHHAIAHVARKYHIDLQDIRYVGDELRDIQACKKIGLKMVAVTWGYDSAKLLKDADHICHSPESLIQLVLNITEP
ncbi:HAD hydrolase-like protein [Paenibacillus arenosi]|uniref:HAD hydrolase-like protein n=1 Tax=Paenibacillus arenosi TaxID=2774142 RepID=A0ABR9AZS5_9BACL|nr:HAD hydrolase-like protein [Paenibacillus arenosi]MBD8498441.1 HAD hydrolase-like protein [Paenibacillus arenosi]